MDEAGVVGGACSVEGVLVCMAVYRKSGFLGELFRLLFPGFHKAEFGGVPWSSVGEGDRSGFEVLVLVLMIYYLF